MRVKRLPTSALVALTVATMGAFAANSLLTREALVSGTIGAASFTLLRIGSGAVVLWLICAVSARRLRVAGGGWLPAAALFAYAALFSFAYNSLSAATGALLLFGAVQASMIVYALWSGERINRPQSAAALAAAGGLLWLMLPGVSAPPLGGAVLMLLAGVAWGVYSIVGRGASNPTMDTAGNFVRATPMAIVVFLVFGRHELMGAPGVAYALASGALASGLGYALWYAVLPWLRTSTAAMVQLSVPVVAAFGGLIWLGEAITVRLLVASLAVLGGIAVFVLYKERAQ